MPKTWTPPTPAERQAIRAAQRAEEAAIIARAKANAAAWRAQATPEEISELESFTFTIAL